MILTRQYHIRFEDHVLQHDMMAVQGVRTLIIPPVKSHINPRGNEPDFPE